MFKTPFIIALASAILALGFFVFVTDAPAYGGSAPETCNNCHAMDSQYENWYHAPHEKQRNVWIAIYPTKMLQFII